MPSGAAGASRADCRRWHTAPTPGGSGTDMRNPMDMTGRTAVVTGAGQGIGKAISELFLDLGANVVLGERNPDTLASAAASMDKDRTLPVLGNVAEEGFGESCVEQAVQRFGAV